MKAIRALFAASLICLLATGLRLSAMNMLCGGYQNVSEIERRKNLLQLQSGDLHKRPGTPPPIFEMHDPEKKLEQNAHRNCEFVLGLVWIGLPVLAFVLKFYVQGRWER
jgi:hypothetical protein